MKTKNGNLTLVGFLGLLCIAGGEVEDCNCTCGQPSVEAPPPSGYRPEPPPHAAAPQPAPDPRSPTIVAPVRPPVPSPPPKAAPTPKPRQPALSAETRVLARYKLKPKESPIQYVVGTDGGDMEATAVCNHWPWPMTRKFERKKFQPGFRFRVCGWRS